VAAVEFAVCFPVVFAILLGMWETSRLVEAQQILVSACREGARAAASGRTDDSYGVAIPPTYPSTVVQNYMQSAGLNTTGYTVTITNLGPGTGTWQTCDQLDHLRVTATLPFNNVRWVVIDTFMGYYGKITNTMSATTDWYSMRDLPITVSPDTMHN